MVSRECGSARVPYRIIKLVIQRREKEFAMADKNPATISDVYNFFAGPGTFGTDGKPTKPTAEQKAEYPLNKFRPDWAALNAFEKAQIAGGIGNRTLDYAVA